MKRGTLNVWLAAALLAGAGVAPAAAETPAEALSRAEKLHQAGKYLEAQTLLRSIDRDALSDEEAERRDALVDEVRKAVNLSRKAADDLSDADRALQAGRLGDAEADYRSVLRNPYANDGQKEAARTGLKRVEEKRALAERVGEPVAAGPRTRTQPVRTEKAAGREKEAKEAVARGDAAVVTSNTSPTRRNCSTSAR